MMRPKKILKLASFIKLCSKWSLLRILTKNLNIVQNCHFLLFPVADWSKLRILAKILKCFSTFRNLPDFIIHYFHCSETLIWCSQFEKTAKMLKIGNFCFFPGTKQSKTRILVENLNAANFFYF